MLKTLSYYCVLKVCFVHVNKLIHFVNKCVKIRNCKVQTLAVGYLISIINYCFVYIFVEELVF